MEQGSEGQWLGDRGQGRGVGWYGGMEQGSEGQWLGDRGQGGGVGGYSGEGQWLGIGDRVGV